MTRLKRVTCGVAAIVLLTAPRPSGQSPSTGPTGAQTRPVSASVLATIVTRDQQMQLAVLWRGTPGWFARGEGHQAASYSEGNSRVFTATLEYGGIALSVVHEFGSTLARVQDKIVSLPPNTNVILVDNIDSAGGATFPDPVAIDPRLPAGNPTLASVFGRSPEVVSFLRCGVNTANEAASRVLNSYACDDLSRR